MPHVRQADSRRDTTTAKYRNWQTHAGDDDTPEPFVDLVQRDPVVCDHCFLLRYTTITKEWWRGEFGWMDYNRWIPVPQRGEPVPAQFPSQGMRLACGNCGYRRSKHRPVAKADVFEFAYNISDTLERKSISFDESVLLDEVEARAGEPGNQGKQDSAVFAPAVKASVRDY